MRYLFSVLTVIFLIPIAGNAQINCAFTATTGTYAANGGTAITGLGSGVDDYTAAAINIGFTFTIGCTNYTTFQANSNGVMFLGTSLATTSANFVNNLTSGSNRPAIAPLWDDLFTSGTGNVNYKLTGSAPNRILTVEWLNMLWDVNALSASVTFQVKLYETSNRIEFIYKLISAANITGSPSASIGLSGATSGDFYSLNNSGSSPTATKGTETTTISTSPATNQIYRWDPSCVSITTGAVSPTSFSLGSCSATGTGTVSFTSTGTFNAGNYYTVWLSDASGSFGTATSVGTLTSTANSGSIPFTIPAGTAAGTGYQLQISSYTPAVTGSNSSNFTITTTCGPGTPVSGVMSNYSTIKSANAGAYGCDNSCSQTSYTVGPFSHPAVCNNDNIVGCASCASVTQSVTFTITAGCTFTAEAEVKARGASCPDAAMDVNDEIHISGSGGGSIVSQYATLTSPGACASIGVVAGVNNYSTADLNDGCGNSSGYAQLVYKAGATDAQITISYTSDRADEILTFTMTANSSACGILVLPVELLGFYAAKVNDGIELSWVTETEINNNYFLVEYSLDGIDFIPFKEIKGAGTSYVKKEYMCLFSEDIGNNTPYFRLKQVDYNGAYKYSNIIMLGNYIAINKTGNNQLKAWYHSEKDKIVTNFHLNNPAQISLNLYSLAGQEIYASKQLFSEGDNEFLIAAPDKAGVYFLVYTENDKLPVHKKILISK